jgi:hypothetical protein
MTEQAISPLRRRMIEDMTIRKFAQKTQHDYVQRVKDFANYLKRSPDIAKPEDVRGFQLHLTSSGAGVPKSGTGHQIQSGVQCRLWRGAATLLGCLTEDLRYQFQTHDVAHRTGQGSQGSLCDAFPDAALASARLVSHRAAARMAVSGPEPN